MSLVSYIMFIDISLIYLIILYLGRFIRKSLKLVALIVVGDSMRSYLPDWQNSTCGPAGVARSCLFLQFGQNACR